MKKEPTASILDSGKGTKHPFCLTLCLLILLTLCISPLTAATLQNHTIQTIHFKSSRPIDNRKQEKYKALLDFRPGDTFSYKKNRKSMENLYKTGIFSDIGSEIEILSDKRLRVVFTVTYKYTLHAVRVKKCKGLKNSNVRAAILSLRKDTWFEPEKIKDAEKEITAYLATQGYFNGTISHKVLTNHQLSRTTIHFFINPGKRTVLENVKITVADKVLAARIRSYFPDTTYIPQRFQRNIEKVRRFLKKKKFYFPVIRLKENFTNEEKSAVNLEVIVIPGFMYRFNFEGISSKIALIASVWEKKVFEKWAEKESQARILHHLRNKGYLNAEIESHITIAGNIKYITFKVDKKKQFRLGKITYTGNKVFDDKELKSIVKADDLFFEKNFYVRARSLKADQGVLQLYYYFKGYPLADVLMKLNYPPDRSGEVDVNYLIKEGEFFSVDTLLFSGNSSIKSEELESVMKTKINRPNQKGPFVQQILNEDIERLKNHYRSRGFASVQIAFEISPGTEKSILINIIEGPAGKLGNLIIIGASTQQEKLLRRLFPLRTGDFFNQIRIDAFRTEVENSSVFNEIRIIKLHRGQNRYDLLIKVVPDQNKYYGFGFGFDWKEVLGLRGTVEYQQRNIFNGYSSLSVIAQAGQNEKRGIISYDTPYFFKRKINSQFRIWMDDEIFPTYQFTRIGIRENLIKKLSANAFVMGGLSAYRTELQQLEIYPNDIDRLHIPFWTAAFTLSYVNENRDNPFNPSSGDFFSANLKTGAIRMTRSREAQDLIDSGALAEDAVRRSRLFVKLRWSYQRNFPFLKKGVFAFNIKNGLALGNLPITERFFGGGVNSFRGVQNNKLGPYDVMMPDLPGESTYGLPPGSEHVKKAKGGNALLLMNLEATFPLAIIPGDDFYYALFLDVGNVYEKIDDINLNRLETAVGFSLKIKTELGPLRFDFGWRLGKQRMFNGKQESNFAWHVGFGNVL